MTDVLGLPFDQYQRYKLVADLVDELRANEKKKFRILDVGGRTGLLRSFLPSDRVTLVDLEPSEAEGLVVGDGSRLPFQDACFDVVCAFDTLEHVPPARRGAFVAEAARVAAHYAMLAGPYRSPRVDEAEEALRAFLRSKLSVEHRYLEEHREHGLPDREEVVSALESTGASVASYGHASLDRWLVLMCMELYMDHDPGLRPIAERFFRFYNGALYASDAAEPVYRHTVVAAFDGAELPAERPLPPAPTDALSTAAELGFELVAFDREKDVWEVELGRLRGIISDLERDLEGHASRLAETEAELEDHRSTLAKERGEHERARRDHATECSVLTADLEEHARSLDETRAVLERTQTETAAERAALEADLAEHRAALATTNADLAAHRDAVAHLRHELEESVEARETLAREAAEQRTVLEADVAGHRAVAASLETDLAGHRATIEDLRRELATSNEARETTAREAADEREKLVRDMTAHRAALATVEADLAEHRVTLATVQAELDASLAARETLARESAEMCAAFEHNLAQHRAALAAAEADLEGHRGTIADLHRLVDAERRARETARVEGAELEAVLRDRLDAHDRLKNELEAHLAETQRGAQLIQGDLLGARAEVEALAREIEARDATVDQLRADLRGRWSNLKRALGPRASDP